MISPSLWSTCANSDERFIATVHWHSLNIETWWRESREGGLRLTQQFPIQKKFSEVHCESCTAAYLWSMKCKIDDINNIGSRGVSEPQAGGPEWSPLLMGSPLPHCGGHYQLWTWRRSPPTLRTSLKQASALFKGADVSPSCSWIDISTFLLIRYFWTKPCWWLSRHYNAISPPASPPDGAIWSVEGGGSIQMLGESFNYFLLNYHFLRQSSKCNQQLGGLICFTLQLLLMEQLSVIIHQ